jgi:predicted RNA-binding protein Jag
VASVETTGPTVDDAIDAALEKLDLDEDQVDLEILSEGGDGERRAGGASRAAR